MPVTKEVGKSGGKETAQYVPIGVNSLETYEQSHFRGSPFKVNVQQRHWIKFVIA